MESRQLATCSPGHRISVGARPRRRTVRMTALLLLLTTALLATPQRGNSQASGATSTAEIALGVGVLIYLEQYFVALGKSKGSAGQADAIADARVPLAKYAYFTGTSSPPFGPPGIIPKAESGDGAWTLRTLRDLLIYDVAVTYRDAPADQVATAADRVAALAEKAASDAAAAASDEDKAAAVAHAAAIAAAAAAAKPDAPADAARKAATAKAVDDAAAQKKANAQEKATSAQSAANDARKSAAAADAAAAATDIAAPISKWRAKFEHLRGCWNQAIAQPASSSPSSPAAASPAKPSPPSGKSGGQTPDQSAPKPSGAGTACDLVLEDYPVLLLKLPFDQIDFAASFSDSSLYQQILNQDVGSHALNNSFREILLFMAANEFVKNLQPVPPTKLAGAAPGVSITDYSNLLSSCITNSLTFSGALGCAGAVGGIEQQLATAQAKHDACAFSRGMWMPMYTIIVTKVSTTTTDQLALFRMSGPAQSTTDAARKDYGPPPGC